MIYCPSCGSETVSARTHHAKPFRVCVSCSARTEQGPPQCECGTAKPRGAKTCVICAERDADRYRGETRRRVLGVLAFQQGDWCCAEDFWSAVGCEEGERKAIYTMLGRLVDDGVIERRGNVPRVEYRLVQRKRRAA